MQRQKRTQATEALAAFLTTPLEAILERHQQSRLPTLVQYDPLSRFFEAREGMLLFSGDNGVPLIRYGILDAGGVISFEAMLSALSGFGFDPRRDPEIEREGGRGVRALPFVYVFGRSDFTVSYFGANIYPENVTVGLERPGIQEWVTGKFVLEALDDEDKNPAAPPPVGRGGAID